MFHQLEARCICEQCGINRYVRSRCYGERTAKPLYRKSLYGITADISMYGQPRRRFAFWWSLRPKARVLGDGAVLFSYANDANYLFCVLVGRLTNNGVRGRERSQRCWATRTTAVPDVSFPMKNFTPRDIYAGGGGLLMASTFLISYSWFLQKAKGNTIKRKMLKENETRTGLMKDCMWIATRGTRNL